MTTHAAVSDQNPSDVQSVHPDPSTPEKAPLVTASAYSCGGCSNTWTRLNACHCSGCHRTFGGVKGFDIHRRGGRCIDPATVTSSTTGIAVFTETNGIWQRVSAGYQPRLRGSAS